jgi:hypothetical protein
MQRRDEIKERKKLRVPAMLFCRLFCSDKCGCFKIILVNRTPSAPSNASFLNSRRVNQNWGLVAMGIGGGSSSVGGADALTRAGFFFGGGGGGGFFFPATFAMPVEDTPEVSP